MKRIAAGGAVVAALIALSGCSAKQIDIAATGAVQVPGAGNLYRFCDGSTLIYFSNYGNGSQDEYEFIVYNGCSTDPNAKTETNNLPDSGN
jgi:hypothetical protein